MRTPMGFFMAAVLLSACVSKTSSPRQVPPSRDAGSAEASTPVLAQLREGEALQRVAVEGTASCLRVRWEEARGPCAEDYVIFQAEELFFADRAQRLSPPVVAGNPASQFPRLDAGEAVRKQLHADSECDQDFEVLGRVLSVEPCLAVRLTGAEQTLLPIAAAQLTPAAALPRAQPLGADDVQAVVRAHEAEVEACVAAHPFRALLPYGGNWSITARWRVMPDGSVAGPEVTSPTPLRRSAVADCITSHLSRWTFPPTAAGLPETGSSFGPFLAR